MADRNKNEDKGAVWGKIKKKERVFTQVLYSTAISLGRAGQ